MKTLIHFKKFVDELKLDNSRTYKMEVLKKYKDDEDIKYYLNYIFNPYITTGISDKKLARFHSDNCIDCYPINKFKTVFDSLNYIKEHNTGSYGDLGLIFSFYIEIILFEIKENIQFNELSSLYEKIIIKNLQLGIDVKTINKVIPNLIPEFNVMLANKYFDKPEYIEGKEFALTTKIDGGRIVAIKKDGAVKFYTRSGQLYEGLVDLEKEMIEYMPDNIALDGEITLLDKGNLNSKEQYKQTMMITRRDGEKHGVKMLVFDAMSADNFLNQRSTLTYKQRREILSDIFDLNQFKYFNLLPIIYQGNDASEITKWLNYNVSQGEEGVMINIVDAPYEFKRTNALLKVKQMQDIDLIITGFELGSNSNSNTLGAIHCNYKGYDLGVGSGFSKEDRDYIWTHQNEFLGKAAVIQYFEETQNDKGGLSLRFPVYKYIREIA